MKAESPRDRRLAGLGVELLDKPVLTPSRDVDEGDVFAITTSALATAFLLVERLPDRTDIASVDADGQFRRDAEWSELSRSEVYVLGSLA